MEKWIFDIILLALKPIIGTVKELREEIQKLEKSLDFYARQISNPGVMETCEISKAGDALRQHAVNIDNLAKTVRCFSFLAFMYVIPKKINIEEAYACLLELSNSLGVGQYDEARNAGTKQKIKGLLSVNTDFCERFSGWIVFILVFIGGFTLLKNIVQLAQNLLG